VPASQTFERAFDTGCAGCVRVCACGKTHYDTENDWDWEEGEYESLESDPNAVPHDCAVGTMNIDGQEIVLGCDCDLAAKYEKFIVAHARQISEYLNARAKLLRDEADETNVAEEVPHDQDH
jgi:hypothetical protein